MHRHIDFFPYLNVVFGHFSIPCVLCVLVSCVCLSFCSNLVLSYRRNKMMNTIAFVLYMNFARQTLLVGLWQAGKQWFDVRVWNKIKDKIHSRVRSAWNFSVLNFYLCWIYLFHLAVAALWLKCASGSYSPFCFRHFRLWRYLFIYFVFVLVLVFVLPFFIVSRLNPWRTLL